MLCVAPDIPAICRELVAALAETWLYGSRPSSTARMPACVNERLV